MRATHLFARLKTIPLKKFATEPIVGLNRKDYSEFHRSLDRLFASLDVKPIIAVECDSLNSLIAEVEAGRGISLATLPPPDGNDGDRIRRHRARNKRRCHTRWRKILRNLAADIQSKHLEGG
jgi:DNA-binding transcriptional LysR family regulator